ncbi:hypothetical protein N7468_007217 [Penicillium chermesinum]|uniref:Stc1 domain-containing protein n=1 Tax=Penicillium chermesinum TaxID=63820 RepID=A0A9W9TKB1_9EURO|nr:uncharacterized protein N7468_007217 [Penicillium chermesinum]KAJ5225992.1 hypothetical protein N7468_007217 [Penicillium chermesinum]
MSLRNRHAAYSRLGYSRELHEKVQAVELPPTRAQLTESKSIQCTRCFSDLPASAFSRRQINELKENIYMEGEEFLLGDEIKIACIPCTFNEKCESRCRNCNQIMSVEYFSRAQRNLDKPICRRCRWHMDNPEPMRPLEERSEDPKPDEPAKPKLEVTRTGWVKVRRGDDEKAAPDMVKESRVHKYAVYGPPRFIPREAFGLIVGYHDCLYVERACKDVY